MSRTGVETQESRLKSRDSQASPLGPAPCFHLVAGYFLESCWAICREQSRSCGWGGKVMWDLLSMNVQRVLCAMCLKMSEDGIRR